MNDFSTRHNAYIFACFGLTLVTLFYTGCWMDDDEQTQQEPPKQTQSTSELENCEEVDLQPSGWIGPGVGEDGKIINPQATYIFAATAGLPKENEEDSMLFGMHSGKVGADLMTREGLIGANFAGSEKCRTGRTMTLWRDRRAMMEFVLGDAHRTAILETTDALSEFKTAHWSYSSKDNTFPTWTFYREKLGKVEATQYE